MEEKAVTGEEEEPFCATRSDELIRPCCSELTTPEACCSSDARARFVGNAGKRVTAVDEPSCLRLRAPRPTATGATKGGCSKSSV